MREKGELRSVTRIDHQRVRSGDDTGGLSYGTAPVDRHTRRFAAGAAHRRRGAVVDRGRGNICLAGRCFGRSQRRGFHNRRRRSVSCLGRCWWVDDRRAVTAVARETKICRRFLAVYKKEITLSYNSIESSDNFERTSCVSPSIVNVCDGRNYEVLEVNFIITCKVRKFRMKVQWIS